MSLASDLDAALLSISNDASEPLAVDETGQCHITVPLVEGMLGTSTSLEVSVRLAGPAAMSLVSPLATIDGDLDGTAAAMLLNRMYYGEQRSGIGYAIADRGNVLVASYHWVLDHLRTEDFQALFSTFVSACIQMASEVEAMAGAGVNLVPVHSA